VAGWADLPSLCGAANKLMKTGSPESAGTDLQASQASVKNLNDGLRPMGFAEGTQ